MLDQLDPQSTTVNVDIFASKFSWIYENFTRIKIRVFSKTGFLGYQKSNFQGVDIFADI